MNRCVNPNNPEFQKILKEIGNPLLAEIEFDKRFPSNEIKEGVDFVFESNPELANVGTPEQYSQYLDTIFPDSKAKDIVYRGGEKEDVKLFQYWTNNKAEAYIYAKAHFSKGGKITERNPLESIYKVAINYFDTKYGEGTYDLISLRERDLEPDDWMIDIDENENIFIKEQYKKELEERARYYANQPNVLKKLSEKDRELLKNIRIVFDLYRYVKIESEEDLMKQYDDTDYIYNIIEYEKARKYVDENLDSKQIRENIGQIKTAILNIKNPYIEEIIQEDLQNDRDAYRNGHDGAFLMDGDHFLVKSNTNQIHELGSKQDIDGFREFVQGKSFDKELAQKIQSKHVETISTQLDTLPKNTITEEQKQQILEYASQFNAPILVFKGLDGKKNVDGTLRSAHNIPNTTWGSQSYKEALTYARETSRVAMFIVEGENNETVSAEKDTPVSKLRKVEEELITNSIADVVYLNTIDGVRGTQVVIKEKPEAIGVLNVSYPVKLNLPQNKAGVKTRAQDLGSKQETEPITKAAVRKKLINDEINRVFTGRYTFSREDDNIIRVNGIVHDNRTKALSFEQAKEIAKERARYINTTSEGITAHVSSEYVYDPVTITLEVKLSRLEEKYNEAISPKESEKKPPPKSGEQLDLFEGGFFQLNVTPALIEEERQKFEKRGITLNQKSDIGIINKLIFRAVTPVSYNVKAILARAFPSLVFGRTYSQFKAQVDIWNKLSEKTGKSLIPKWSLEITEEQYKKREDAWLLSNGLPQLHNTFKYVGRGFVKDGRVVLDRKGEDIYDFNIPVFNHVDIDRALKDDKKLVDSTNFVMGNYGISVGRDELGYFIRYTDRWDLDLSNPIIKQAVKVTQKPFIVTGKLYKAAAVDESGNIYEYYTQETDNPDIKFYKDFMLGLEKHYGEESGAVEKDEYEQSSSKASPQTLALVKELLRKMGVDIKSVSDIIVNNKKISANGVAQIVAKLVQVLDGKEATALPEEAMHFVVEIIQQKDPALFKQLLKEINRYDMYKLVNEAYGTNPLYQTPEGKPDVLKLKKEAIAKVLVEKIIKRSEGKTEHPELLFTTLSWWEKILNSIRNLFFSSGFDKLTLDIISGKFEGKADDINLEQEAYYLQQTRQQQIFNSIRATANYVQKGKGDEGYIVDGEKKARVHDTIRSWYDQIKKELTGTEFEKAVDDVYKEKGTENHYHKETAFNSLVDPSTGLKRETEADDSFYTNDLDATQLKIYNVLKQNLKERLAGYPDDTMFMSESIVYNPNRIFRGKKGLAGTIDFIAITSAGKVHVLDWKFMKMDLKNNKYTDIPWYKMSEWEQQMTEYKYILHHGYGIPLEDFVQTRMIPFVSVYEEADYKREILPKLKEVIVGDADVYKIEEDYLLPYAIRQEKTGNKEIDSWVEKLNSIYSRLFKKKMQTEEERKNKNEQLNQIVKAIRYLQIKQDVTPLVEQAHLLNSQAQMLIDKYNKLFKGGDPKSFSEKEINDFSKDINEYITTLTEYAKIDDELSSIFDGKTSEEDEKLKKDVDDVSRTARRTQFKLNRIREEFTRDILLPKENVKWSDAEKVVRGWARWFQTTSTIQTSAIQFLYKKASKMLYFAAAETTSQSIALKEIQEEYKKWAISKGLSRKNYFNLIKKQDENELIDEFNPEFYNLLKTKIKEKDFDWIRNNIDEEAYAKELKAVRDREVEWITKKSLVRPEDIKNYEQTGELPAKAQRDIDRAYNLYNISTPASPGWLLYDQVKKFPIKDKWESNAWKELHKPENAPAKRFYDYIIERNKEYHSIGYITNERTFLPFVEKSTLERLTADGKLPILENFLRTISVDEEQVGYGARDPFTKELINEVPKYFVSEIDNPSDDLFRTMALYNEAALKYKHLTLIEDQLMAVLKLERNKKSIATSMFGRTAKEEGTDRLRENPDNSENAQLYEDMMNVIVYGQKYLKNETFDQLLLKLGSWGKTLNSKLGVEIFPENLEGRQVSLNKSIDSLNRTFQLTTLGVNLASALSNGVGGTLQSIINAEKYFSKSDWVASQLKLATNHLNTDDKKKFLSAMYYFLPLTENYNRQLANALTINKLQPDAVQDVLMSMMRFTDRAVQLTNFYAYMSNTIVKDGQLFNVREYLKKQPKYSSRYSLPKNERKVLEEEFEKEVKQLLETNGLEKVAKYENGEFVIPGVERLSDTVVEFRRKVQQLNKDALGNLTEDDVRKMNANIYGKSFMVFKNWIPRPLDVRVGSFKYNSASDAYEWGRMRTVIRYLSTDFMSALDGLKSAILGNDERYVQQILALYEKKKEEYEGSTGKEFEMTQDEFVDLVRRNIRSQIYELMFLSTLMAMLFGLKQLPDDDDDEEVKNQYRYVTRLFDKFTDELWYFYDITSMSNHISRGMFPAISLVDNMRKAFKTFAIENWALLTGNEQLEKDTKVIKYWMKVFPFTNQMTGYIPMFYPELAKELGIRTQANYGIR